MITCEQQTRRGTIRSGLAIGGEQRSRRDAIRNGLVIGAGLVAASAIAPLRVVSEAFAEPRDEADIVEGLVRLEQTAVVAYSAAVEANVLRDRSPIAELFRDQEEEHLDAVSEALEGLGGSAPDPPARSEIEGLGAARSADAFLEFAIALETQEVVAYDDAATLLSTPDLLTLGAQIVSNQAQHLVVLRQELGVDPVPGAFEAGISEVYPEAG